MRFFFAFNIILWFVLFAGWLGYIALAGAGDPVSGQVGLILGVTAVLLTMQGLIRARRSRRVRVSA